MNSRCNKCDEFVKNFLLLKKVAINQTEKIEELKNKDIQNISVIKKLEEDICLLKEKSEVLVKENEKLKISNEFTEKEIEYNQQLFEKDNIILGLNCKLSNSVNDLKHKIDDSINLNKILKNVIADLSQQHQISQEICLKLGKFIIYCSQRDNASISENLLSIRSCLLDFLDNSMNKSGTDLLGSIKRLIERVDSLTDIESDQISHENQRDIVQSSVDTSFKTVTSYQPIRFDDIPSVTECAIMTVDDDRIRLEPEVNTGSIETDLCITEAQTIDKSEYTDCDKIYLDSPDIPKSFDRFNMSSDEETGQSATFNAIRNASQSLGDTDSTLERITHVNFGNRSKHPHLIIDASIESESSSDDESMRSNRKMRKKSISSASNRLEIELETTPSVAKIYEDNTVDNVSNHQDITRLDHPIQETKRPANDTTLSIEIPIKRRKRDLQLEIKDDIPESIIGYENISGPVCNDIEIDINSSLSLIRTDQYSNCKPDNHHLQFQKTDPPKTTAESLSVDIDCPLNMNNKANKSSSSSTILTPKQTSIVSQTHSHNQGNHQASSGLQESPQTIPTENALKPIKKLNNSPDKNSNHKSDPVKTTIPQHPLDAIRAAEIQRRVKLAEKITVKKPSQENLEIKLSETLKRLSDKKQTATRKEPQATNNNQKRNIRQQQADLMELRPITRENLIMERMTKQDLSDMKITQFKTDSISGTKRKREDEQIKSKKTKPQPKRNIVQSKPHEETKSSSSSKLINVNLGQYLLRHQINEKDIIKHQQLVTFTAYNPMLSEPRATGNELIDNRNKIPEKTQPIKRVSEATNLTKSSSEISQSKPKALESANFIETNPIVTLFHDLMKENEKDFFVLIGQKIPIAAEIDANRLIDGIFDLFKSNNDKPFKHTFLINAIFQLILSIISRCQKVYGYFYSSLLQFIKSAESHSARLVVILATVSFYINLQQWDKIVGFFVDLLRLPNVYLLKLVPLMTPDNFFPQQTGTKYDSIRELFKRLVMYEYSTTSDEDCKRQFANSPIDIQKYWLNGQTVQTFQPMNDLKSIIESANQIIEEYKSKNFKLKLDLLDKDLEIKYFIK